MSDLGHIVHASNFKTVERRDNPEEDNMKKHLISLSIFLSLIPIMLLVNCTASGQAFTLGPATATGTFEVVNIDGDVSLSEAQNRIHWNPHSTGLTQFSTWNATFENETEISLKTKPGEAGHVATGAWWTTSFKSNAKIPLYTLKPIELTASFRANVAAIDYEPHNEWLRIALACAVQRSDHSVVYTELDFWDSPSTLKHPSGNTKFGGNTVYRGGDVVEYKIDQAIIGKWENYSLDLTGAIDSAWSLKPGDLLESVYLVVETIGPSTVSVRFDDLWIAQIG